MALTKMTQDEAQAAIREEWDKLSNTDKSKEVSLSRFCHRMADQHTFRSSNRLATIQD